MILLPPEETEALCSPEHQALHNDLRRGWHAKTVMALAAQDKIAKVFQDLGPRHNETLGQLTMVVDPHIYYEMRRIYGRDCWKDKGFRRRFAKDNPSANIRSRSSRIQVGVNGLRPAGSIVTP